MITTGNYTVGNSPATTTPVLGPTGGTFSNSVQVTVTNTTPGTIFYYTTDGSMPTTNSLVYTGPISLTNSATIKVIGVSPGHSPSVITTGNYTVGNSPATTTLTVLPNGGGSVTGGGTYAVGSNAVLTATAATGWRFVSWNTGATNGLYTVVVPATNYTYTAIFQRQQETVGVAANPPGAGTVNGGGTVGYGTNITVVAVANPGDTFVNWTENGIPVSTATRYTFTVTTNRNLTANFNGVTITTANPLPTGTNGVAYSQLFQAAGGVGPYTWSLGAGRLPAGLTLNATSGLLSGRPTGVGIYDFRVNVTDRQNLSASNNFSVVIGNVAGPLAGTYTGLIIDTNTPPCAGSGYIKIVLAKTGAFAGNLTLAGHKTAFTGQFDATGNATNTVAGLSLALQVDMTGGSGQITGWVTGGGVTAVLLAELSNTSPLWQGTYTLALSPADVTATNVPQGYGYATLIVSRSGIGTLTGVLNDGTPLKATAPVLQSGLWPLYVPLYKNATGYGGACVGWVTFTNNTEVTGQLDWCAPASKGYSPFSTTLTVDGSQYTTGPQPLAGTWTVTLNGGGLTNLVKTVTIDANGNVTVLNPGVDALTLKLLTKAKILRIVANFAQMTTATGQFTGSFKATVGGNAIAVKFNGLLLQVQHAGAGLFQPTTGKTGGISIEPVVP